MRTSSEAQRALVEHYRSVVMDSSKEVQRCDTLLNALVEKVDVRSYLTTVTKRETAYERMRHGAESLALTIVDPVTGDEEDKLKIARAVLYEVKFALEQPSLEGEATQERHALLRRIVDALDDTRSGDTVPPITETELPDSGSP